MILALYALFIALALASIFIGGAARKPPLSIFGFGLLFVCAIIIFPYANNLLPGVDAGVQYQTGHNDTVTGNDTIRTYSYATYQSYTIGFYLALAAILGFILVMFDFRDDRENWEKVNQ